MALTVISVVRALVEMAMLALLGRGAVALLAGRARDGNPVYRLFAIVTRPVVRLVRRVAPRPVIDRHIPLLAFLLLFWLWILLAWAKYAAAN